MAGLLWAWLLVCALMGPAMALLEGESTASGKLAAAPTWGGLPETLLPRSMILNSHGKDVKFDADKTPWVEQVGLHPRVYYFHNFLTEEERHHMLRLSYPQMKRSTVVGADGSSVVDEIRTSYGMFIHRRHDNIIERIENRIALWTHIPVEHQEDIQVLRYQKTQTYGAHYDSSYDKKEPGPHFRLATFLIYLSDVEEGGETAFPKNSVWYDPSIPKKMGPVSDCAKGHVAAKPKAGDAVLFYSYHANGTMDNASMHTGCPVIKGIKWAAPVWIHTDQFRPEEFKRPVVKNAEDRNPGMCEDLHSMCSKWASEGECEKNRGFMMGDATSMGNCRRSCKVCEHCSRDDLECINRNRAKSGYLKLDRKELTWLGVEDLLEGHSEEL